MTKPFTLEQKLDQDKEKRREQASREKEIMRELEEWKAQLYLLLEDSHTFFDNLEVKVLLIHIEHLLIFLC